MSLAAILLALPWWMPEPSCWPSREFTDVGLLKLSATQRVWGVSVEHTPTGPIVKLTICTIFPGSGEPIEGCYQESYGGQHAATEVRIVYPR